MPDLDPQPPKPSAAPGGAPVQTGQARHPSAPSGRTLEDGVRGSASALEFARLINGISSAEEPPVRPAASAYASGVAGRNGLCSPSAGSGRAYLAWWLIPSLALALLLGAGASWLYLAGRAPRSVPDSASARMADFSAVYTPGDARTLANVMSRMPQPLRQQWRSNGGKPANTVFGRGGDTHLELVFASSGGAVRRIWQVWPTRGWAPAWQMIGTVPRAGSIRMGLLRSTRGLEVQIEDGRGAAWEAHEINPNTERCHWSEWASVR